MVQPDTNGRGGWLEGKAGRGEFPEMKGYADTPDRHRHARECAPADAMTRAGNDLCAQAQIVSTGASTAISTNETVRSFMRSKLQTEFILLDQGWILVPGNAEL